jgi:hypothetical protein
MKMSSMAVPPVEVSGPSGMPLDAIDVMSVEVRRIQIFDDDDYDDDDDDDGDDDDDDGDNDGGDNDDDDVISYCHEVSLSSTHSSTHLGD